MPKLPLKHLTLLLPLSLLTACSSVANTRNDAHLADQSIGTTATIDTLGNEIALRALALVGKPYRYGGADLEGFDCSGLVFYIHEALGLTVPRTAADQQRASENIGRTQLQPGDLLFFKTTSSARISHVGIYVGENRFVHAPQSGKLIELRSLDDSYYGPRLTSVGRLHPAS
jgi:hypothetical protein